MIKLPHVLRACALAALLSGCAGQQGQMPYAGGPGDGPHGPMGRHAAPESQVLATPATGGTAGATASSPHEHQAMCALHQRVMAARTPEERQAIMDQHMQGMAPDMRERHMHMMRERCR